MEFVRYIFTCFYEKEYIMKNDFRWKNSRVNIVILSIFLTLIIIFSGNNTAFGHPGGTISWGSRGEEVRTVQQKLKRWGYFEGAVDGVYGSETYRAVVYFQKKNGLKADGVIGTNTKKALGISASSDGGYQGTGDKNNDGDVYLLARAIYGEARGEPYEGMVAVAAVVLNRVRNVQFPNTIAGVIYQPGAFTAVSDGQINLTPNDEALRAARDAMNGWDPSQGAIYYYNPTITTNTWIYSRAVHVVIGRHHFAS